MDAEIAVLDALGGLDARSPLNAPSPSSGLPHRYGRLCRGGEIHRKSSKENKWVPNKAGSALRTDLVLPHIETVVEAKKTRSSPTAKTPGEYLKIDITRYKKHPQCR